MLSLYINITGGFTVYPKITENDLASRITADEVFQVTENEMDSLIRAEGFTGRAKEQTEEFLSEIRTLFDVNKALLGVDVSITV